MLNTRVINISFPSAFGWKSNLEEKKTVKIKVVEFIGKYSEILKANIVQQHAISFCCLHEVSNI